MADDVKWYQNLPLVGGILGGLDLIGDVANFGLGLKQYGYQKELNQTLMNREDSAWQRAVADAQKAGISKAQIGSGASAQQLNAGSMPSIQTDLQQRKLNALSMQDMQTRIGIQDQEEQNAYWTAQLAKLNFRDAFLSSPFYSLFRSKDDSMTVFGLNRNDNEWRMDFSKAFSDYKKQDLLNYLRGFDRIDSQYNADIAAYKEMAEHPWLYQYGSSVLNSMTNFGSKFVPLLK